MTIKNDHAVIIGGSSGIGLATAHRLLDEGMKVTIAGRDNNRLDAAISRLQGNVTAISFDATDRAQVEPFFEDIDRFDHLVLTFGSGRGLGAFRQLDLAEVRRGFEEKVWPHLHCAQVASKVIRKEGSMTFISAVTAQMAAPGTAGLAAANGVLTTLTPLLAAELRPLRVNAVCPGVIDTPWWTFLPENQRKAAFLDYAGKTPVGRVGVPDDIAEAIAFLVRDSFMTGHVLVCDGGLQLAA
jgi:NAD(P)-dependent dehydrogenase (short-subunit alcohol dehydrogenase family)